MHILHVLDSHTGGEPTRLVVSGGPDLGNGPLAERRRLFQERFDHFRSAVVNEPRGSDVMVGALLCEPCDPACAAGVIFFNNVGTLHMCGHGTIGLLVSLHYLGRIGLGTHRIETPVGTIEATLEDRNTVRIRNVPSWRYRAAVPVQTPEGPVSGDIAWGGNWFFLTQDHGERLEASNTRRLTDRAEGIRKAIEAAGLKGEDGGVIDHIELVGPSPTPGVNARNFVLCPGLAYDRSPCGTGTSAKVACLAADGKLKPGQIWRQESVIGSEFQAGYEPGTDGKVIPFVRGTAHVNSDNRMIVDPRDPFAWGIRG